MSMKNYIGRCGQDFVTGMRWGMTCQITLTDEDADIFVGW
jgi:hypothetical protein